MTQVRKLCRVKKICEANSLKRPESGGEIHLEKEVTDTEGMSTSRQEKSRSVGSRRGNQLRMKHLA